MRQNRKRTPKEKAMIDQLQPIVIDCQQKLKSWQWDINRLPDVIQVRPVLDIVSRVIHSLQYATNTDYAMTIANKILSTPIETLFERLVQDGDIVGNKFMGVTYDLWSKRHIADKPMPDEIKKLFGFLSQMREFKS
jgi:hypothetical protein